MPAGDPGKEQFARAIVTLRNLYIVAGMHPLILFRQELLGNDELSDRGGTDDPTRDHFVALLINADRWRRRVTHNPESEDLGTLIEEAISTDGEIDQGENPFGGDDIQNTAGGLIPLPFSLDGTDVDLPILSQLQIKSGNALVLLGQVDRVIVNWTRMNSRDRTKFITRFDSMRIFGDYQAILGYLRSFCGDDNRVDVSGVLPSQEPLGPTDSPNMKSETARPS